MDDKVAALKRAKQLSRQNPMRVRHYSHARYHSRPFLIVRRVGRQASMPEILIQVKRFESSIREGIFAATARRIALRRAAHLR